MKVINLANKEYFMMFKKLLCALLLSTMLLSKLQCSSVLEAILFEALLHVSPFASAALSVNLIDPVQKFAEKNNPTVSRVLGVASFLTVASLGYQIDDRISVQNKFLFTTVAIPLLAIGYGLWTPLSPQARQRRDIIENQARQRRDIIEKLQEERDIKLKLCLLQGYNAHIEYQINLWQRKLKDSQASKFNDSDEIRNFLIFHELNMLRCSFCESRAEEEYQEILNRLNTTNHA